MSYKWTDKKTSLCYKGRYFRDGDKIPSGILADDRIEQFIRAKKITTDNVKKSEVVTPAKPVTEDEISPVESERSIDKRGKKFFGKNEKVEPKTIEEDDELK